MEMDAILQLIETDEKTREAIQKQYAKRAELKQAVEEEKKKLKRMKNRCTEQVQEVQALGQLVSVS